MFKCNNCRLGGEGEPKTVVQDRADWISFGEVAVCPDCGSDDIEIGEFTKAGRRLVACSMSDELRAARAFLAWQQCGKAPAIVMDAGISLRAGRGKPSVVLFEGDKQLAVGFWEIIRYWQDNGLALC
jgi:hypothetical protein